MTVKLFEHSIISSFPDFHPEANLEIGFQRNFRIQNDRNDFEELPGMGWFPIEYAGDHLDHIPENWSKNDIVIPMYQSEALSIHFHSQFIEDRNTEYPFAVQLTINRVDAISGDNYKDSLINQPKNFFIVTDINRIDGTYENDSFQQFVAIPNSYNNNQFLKNISYYTLEINIFPLIKDKFDNNYPCANRKLDDVSEEECTLHVLEEALQLLEDNDIDISSNEILEEENLEEDIFNISEWNMENSKKLIVHIINSYGWKQISKKDLLHAPLKSNHYQYFGLSWQNIYNE